ncbi:hypothetical protein [Sediminibacillus halophilus]|uniref:hypothetical protein n=1 Tax=Sediminibacillus halophilus TaxID=482461 RepID=UPI00111420B5|nr:hypothetical protein [Sediminibacillus halophilus]
MSSNCLLARKKEREVDVIKLFVSLFICWCLTAILLCSSAPESHHKQTVVFKGVGVSLKIEGGKEGQYYLIQTVTDGSQHGDLAVFPQDKSFVMDEKDEEKEVLHTLTEYTINVFGTEYNDTDEPAMNRLSGSEKSTTTLLKTINITPEEDTNSLTIDLNE